MTVDPQTTISCVHTPIIKLHSGTSVVNVKPIFSYDSKHIIVASGYDIKIFSISSGECSFVLKGHRTAIVSIQVSATNILQILSCSEDGIVLRWDYTEGKLVKKYNLKIHALYFCVPPKSKCCFAISQGSSKYEFEVYSVTLHRSTLTHFLTRTTWAFVDNSVSFSPDGNYLAAINCRDLNLYDVTYNKSKKTNSEFIISHLSEHNLTCVAWHPVRQLLATGDIMGQIIIWINVFSERPDRTVYHWHSLPLPDLVFSHEGSHLYSGGGETVLLKWNLDMKTRRPETIPRLGLPICRLAISNDNSYVSVAHVDNELQIISSTGSVVQIIQGLTRGCNTVLRRYYPRNVRRMTMLYDPRSTALVNNGRTGHLQFYDTTGDKQLFQLDIVNQNFMSQEREMIIYNTEVLTFAIDDKGLWLATLESRNDGVTSPEVRLKFWQFELSSQKFVLNTNVFLPHNKAVNCLKFQPTRHFEYSSEDFVPLAVTTSDDNRFKIWTLSGKHNDKDCWTCEHMGYYKDIRAGEACFSEDGSLLCVAFDYVATVWTPATNILKATLCQAFKLESIKFVLFGREDCSHLLVSCTQSMLNVWNVITLSVVWNINCNVIQLVDDHISGVMAAFTKERQLFVFKPNEAKPLTVMQNISSSPIISAVFIPSEETDDSCSCWQSRSKLYFLNRNQELLVLDDSTNTEKTEKVMLKQSLPITPFGLLKAEETISDVKEIKQIQHLLHGADMPDTSEPMELPCPSYVNPVLLCQSALPMLLSEIKKRNSKRTKNKTSKKHKKEEETDSEEESDDVSVTEMKVTTEELPKTREEYTNDINLLHISNYDFLLKHFE